MCDATLPTANSISGGKNKRWITIVTTLKKLNPPPKGTKSTRSYILGGYQVRVSGGEEWEECEMGLHVTSWAILAFDMSDEEKEGVQVALHNEGEIYGNT